MADLGHQEASAALHRWVRVREVRRVEHWHAEHFELGILVGDRAGLLIVHDFGGTDAPQRWAAAVGAARREAALLEFGDVAVAADGATRRDPRIVTGGNAE